jgi:nicotinamide riboside kinase
MSNKTNRIALCSTVSCGKTTLVNELAKLPQFQNYFIATERSKYLRDLGIPLNTDSTIIGQSIFGSERLSELLHQSMITDRSIIDVMSFTNLAQSINSIDKEAFESYFERFISEYDYIFYISPEGIEIEDNGVRTVDPEYRTAIDQEIQRLISKYKYKIKNYHEINGPTDERIKQLLEITNL